MKNSIFIFLVLVACAPLSEEEMAEINKDADVVRYDGDSVTVSSYFTRLASSSDTFSASKDAVPEASRVCALNGKHAELIGSHQAATPTYSPWTGLDYKTEFEFACI